MDIDESDTPAKRKAAEVHAQLNESFVPLETVLALAAHARHLGESAYRQSSTRNQQIHSQSYPSPSTVAPSLSMSSPATITQQSLISPSTSNNNNHSSTASVIPKSIREIYDLSNANRKKNKDKEENAKPTKKAKADEEDNNHTAAHESMEQFMKNIGWQQEKPAAAAFLATVNNSSNSNDNNNNNNNNNEQKAEKKKRRRGHQPSTDNSVQAFDYTSAALEEQPLVAAAPSFNPYSDDNEPRSGRGGKGGNRGGGNRHSNHHSTGYSHHRPHQRSFTTVPTKQNNQRKK